MEDKEQLGLTTLFPGQKRRISHLSKQGKEVSVCTGVLGGGWQERKDLLSAEQGQWVSLVDAAQHSLCGGAPGTHIQSELCIVQRGAGPRAGRVRCR